MNMMVKYTSCGKILANVWQNVCGENLTGIQNWEFHLEIVAENQTFLLPKILRLGSSEIW